MSEFTAELIRKAASGDQDAITELYELTYSNVYKTVKSMIADESTALDILQDSYVKAFQSLAQLDSPENFGAWLKRIDKKKTKTISLQVAYNEHLRYTVLYSSLFPQT